VSLLKSGRGIEAWTVRNGKKREATLKAAECTAGLKIWRTPLECSEEKELRAVQNSFRIGKVNAPQKGGRSPRKV